MESVSNMLAVADKSVSILRTNPYLSGIVTIFLILYAGLAAPALPPQIAAMFDNGVVKVILIALMLILLRGQSSGIALLLAIGFVISLHTLSTYRMFGTVHNAVAASSGRPYAEFQPGPISTVAWESKGDQHKVQLRGFTYDHQDVKNLLPGGHGWIEN